MQLIYCYIEEYKALKNAGIHFDNRYECSVEKNGEQYELTINKAENFDALQKVNDFVWGDSNISSMSAIVGDNGSGKTTVLEAIVHMFSENIGNFKMIYVVEDNGSMETILTPAIIDNVKVPDNIKVNSLDDWTTKRDVNYKHSNIYISTMFEETLLDAYRTQYDFSTTLILHDSLSRGTRSLLPFWNAETIAQINYLNRVYNEKKKKIRFPKRLIVTLPKIDYENNLTREELELKYVFELFPKEPSFTSKFVEAIFYHIVKYHRNFYELKGNGAQRKVWELFSRVINYEIRCYKEINKGTIDYIEMLIMIVEALYKNKAWGMEYYMNILNEFKSFSKECDINKIFKGKDLIEITYYLDNTNVPKILKFFSGAYSNLRAVHEGSELNVNFKLTWTGISSGEYAYLTFFSRLYQLKNERMLSNNYCLLLIDEPDHNLHVSWQSEFISLLKEFLHECFPKKTFQVIFTTHSPIMLSDVHQSNVVYMRQEETLEKSLNKDEKDEQQQEKQIKLVIESGRTHKQTFAQNIHELFKDAFFLKNTRGTLANSVLERIEERLSKEEFWQQQEQDGEEIVEETYEQRQADLNELEPVIDHIGEPVLRNFYKERLLYLQKKHESDSLGAVKQAYDKLTNEEKKKFIEHLLQEADDD